MSSAAVKESNFNGGQIAEMTNLEEQFQSEAVVADRQAYNNTTENRGESTGQLVHDNLGDSRSTIRSRISNIKLIAINHQSSSMLWRV